MKTIDPNISVEEFEEDYLPLLLANEKMCRKYLTELEKVIGIKYPVPIMELTHQQCIDIAVKVWTQSRLREKQKKVTLQ